MRNNKPKDKNEMFQEKENQREKASKSCKKQGKPSKTRENCKPDESTKAKSENSNEKRLETKKLKSMKR